MCAATKVVRLGWLASTKNKLIDYKRYIINQEAANSFKSIKKGFEKLWTEPEKLDEVKD